MIVLKNIDEDFRKLGIEKTLDLKTVKRAYSKKIAEYHPEENPNEWKEVHDAYISVKGYIEKRNKAQDFSEDNANKKIEAVSNQTLLDVSNRFLPKNKEDDKDSGNQENISSQIESSQIESSKIESFQIESFQIESPQIESPQIESPQIEDQEIKEREEKKQGEVDSELIDELIDSEKASIIVENKSKEDYEKYKIILLLLRDITTKRALDDGRNVVFLHSFNQLREHPLYEDAMTYSIFVSKLAGVFQQAVPEPGIQELIEKDIEKAKTQIPDGQKPPIYDLLIKAIDKSGVTPGYFKKSVKQREKNLKAARASHVRTYSASGGDFNILRIIYAVIIIMLTISRCSS